MYLPNGFQPQVLGKTGNLGETEGSGAGTAILSLAWLAQSIACAYHGYKRNNDSVGWAIGWWFFGGLFPIPGVPVVWALAQGFADPKDETVEYRKPTHSR